MTAVAASFRTGLGLPPKVLTWQRMGATTLSEELRGSSRTSLPGVGFADDLITAEAEAAARRTLRGQIARLERELSDAFITAFAMGGLPQPVAGPAAPRLLDLGELERVRDDLSQRLRAARITIRRRADEQAAKRVLLERMLLDPGSHRFARIARSELGERGCGVWQVRPRLGLIGMLMGWWQVKLSSGCPLPGGHGWRALRLPVARLL